MKLFFGGGAATPSCSGVPSDFDLVEEQENQGKGPKVKAVGVEALLRLGFPLDRPS